MDTEQQRVSDELATFFNTMYENAHGDAQVIPWVKMAPRPLFREWPEREGLRGEGKRALVVACGLGDDAEELARLGFDVTAFDISPVAIEWCKQRFPTSRVHYGVADLFAAPASWQGAFDFVLEIYTLQSLTRSTRVAGMASIASFLAPGGKLLVLCRGAEENDATTARPWPVKRSELTNFQRAGLQEVSFEDIPANEQQGRHFRVVYQRPTEQ
jgi:SAM-dependent methyltransferase